jgi:VCBS repeat protein
MNIKADRQTRVQHPSPAPRQNSRSGVVLIAVVGVLAILMLMSGTLALAARLAYKQSRAYSDNQSVTVFFDGLETYCKGILHRDKYGVDSLAYSFSLAPSMPTVPTDDMDETYDWWGEEFLQVQQPYDAVEWATNAYGLLADTDADGTPDVMAPWWDGFSAMPGMAGRDYPPLSGGSIRVRVALIWDDVGAGKADIGASGNPTDAQNQGLTPFELMLSAVNTGAIPSEITEWRNGPNSQPGEAGDDSERMPDYLDKNANDSVNDAAVPEDFLEYSPIYAVDDDRPFGPYDLADLFLLKSRGSDAARELTVTHGVAIPNFRFLTTGSAVSFMTPRAVYSNRAYSSTQPSRLLNSRFFAQYGVRGLPMPRDLSQVILEMAPSELAAFLWSLDPVVRSYGASGNGITTDDDQQVVIRQIATNLKDMIDSDTSVTVWSDGTRTYYGVETVPYLAECEFAVPLDTSGAGQPPGSGGLLYRDTFDPESQTAPLGKYIKLVNPWNMRGAGDTPYIALDDYQVVLPAEWGGGVAAIPRLRRWVLAEHTDALGDRHRTWIAVPADNDITIDLTGGRIPVRGHYIIADDAATLNSLTDSTAGYSLPAEYNTVEADLAQAQECQGWPRGDAVDTGFLVVHFEHHDNGLAIGNQNRVSVGDRVALFSDPNVQVGVCSYLDRAATPYYMLLTPPPGGSFVVIADGEGILNMDSVANGNARVDSTIAVGEPIYDYFEQPPGSTAVTAQPWITAWANAGASADQLAVRARLQAAAVPGEASVVQVQQRAGAGAAWRTIQEVPLSGAGADDSTDTEDDWFFISEFPGADSALQIGEPRPCWFDREPGTGNIVARDPNNGPWGDYAWRKVGVQRLLPDTPMIPGDVQCTTDLDWVNRRWKQTTPARVMLGDRWAHISATSVENIWDSFPPVRHLSGNAEDVAHRPFYTGTFDQNTTVMNIGRLTTPGDLGFIHAGVPWASVSLGNYGGTAPNNIQTVVHLRHFMDCIAAPRPPWEARPGNVGVEPRHRMVMPAGDVQAVTTGDFNGDGVLDLVAALASTSGGSGEVHIMLGQRGGGFLPSTGAISNATWRGFVPPATPPVYPRFATADFDADGNLDLAVTDPDGGAGRVYVLFGNGNATFGAPVLVLPTVANQVPAGIAVGDLNGDGRPDLIFTDNQNSLLHIRHATAGQAFATPGGTPITVDNVGAVTLADLDGDGYLDAATVNISALTDHVSILAGASGGALALPVNRSLVAGVDLVLKDIVAADVNSNGRLDLVVLAGITGVNSGVHVLRDVHADNIATATQSFHATADVPEKMAAADLNGDGLVDLVTVSEASRSVSTLINDPSLPNHWPPTSANLDIAPPAPTPWPFPNYQRPLSVTIADLDANGTPDVCIGLMAEVVGGPGATGVLLNQGTPGRFFGRINVNTAPRQVLRALFKQTLADDIASNSDGPPWFGVTPASTADAMADAIVAERNSAGGPFTTLDNFFSRMATSLALFPVVDTGAGDVFGFRTEAQARFMANLITVRTDQWGVRLRVQYYRDVDNSGGFTPGDEPIADRKGVLVLDRSVQPIRTVIKRWVPEGRTDTFD